MRRRRIRYKKLFFSLLCLILLLVGIGWGVHQAYLHFTENRTRETGQTDYYLFLGLGKEPADEVDAIWLMAYNRKLNEIHVIALPGSTRVSNENEPLILLKNEYKDGRAEKTISSVENLLHIRISHYAVFDETSFTEMMGKLGNIEFYVEKNMNHSNREGVTDIKLRQGVQYLDGPSSYGYLRYAENPEDEIGRIQRNQRFLKTLISVQKNNLPYYNRIMIQRGWTPSETDISAADAGVLASEVTKMPAENIHFMILPGKAKTPDGIRIWDINPVELQSAIGAVLGQAQPTAK